MNARTRQLQLTVESRQISDTAKCFFHTLLLHRTIGKFNYSTDTSYTVGSLGLEEVICEEVDLAYVRVSQAVQSIFFIYSRKSMLIFIFRLIHQSYVQLSIKKLCIYPMPLILLFAPVAF